VTRTPASSSGDTNGVFVVGFREPGCLLCDNDNCSFGCCCECRDANRVNEEWFADMEGVKAAVGMMDEQPDPPGSQDKVISEPALLLLQCMCLLTDITELNYHFSAVHSCTAQQRSTALALLAN